MTTERQLAGSIGGHTTRSRNDPRVYTAKARAAFAERWLREVDGATPGLPEAERQKRAEALKSAYFKRLALIRHRKKEECSGTKKNAASQARKRRVRPTHDHHNHEEVVT